MRPAWRSPRCRSIKVQCFRSTIYIASEIRFYLSTAGVAIHLAKKRARGKARQVDGDIAEEVEGVAEQHRLHVGDRLHSGDVRVDLRFLLDVVRVADGEAVEEIHEDDDDEKDEGEEEGVGKHAQVGVGVHGQVAELQLPDKHGGGLDQGGPRPVEVLVLVLFLKAVWIFDERVVVQHDVEAHAEGDEEERVPEEKEEEAVEDLVEHRHIHVAMEELGMPA